MQKENGENQRGLAVGKEAGAREDEVFDRSVATPDGTAERRRLSTIHICSIVPIRLAYTQARYKIMHGTNKTITCSLACSSISRSYSVLVALACIFITSRSITARFNSDKIQSTG